MQPYASLILGTQDKILASYYCTIGSPHLFPRRENTVLRAALTPSSVFVIPNAVVSDQFKPASEIVPLKPRASCYLLNHSPLLSIYFEVNIVVISRLAYRKGVDLLVATAPKVCERFPDVRFIIGRSTVWRCSMKYPYTSHCSWRWSKIDGALANAGKTYASGPNYTSGSREA